MRHKIDIHCHILPDVDDGPQTMADSLMLASVLVNQGFAEIIATPHYIEDYSAAYRNHIKQQYKALQTALQVQGIPLQLHLGGEVMLTSLVVQQADSGTLPVLANTNHVLLELPLRQEVLAYASQVIFHLQIKGYQPIIAHPERVEFIKQDPRCLLRLLESGVLLQVNMGSLFGLYGKRAKQAAEFLLANQMAHFLATDSHHASQGALGHKLTKLAYPLELLMGENPHNLLNQQRIKQLCKREEKSYSVNKLIRFLKNILGR